MRYASIQDPTMLFGFASHPGKSGKNNEDDFALFEAPWAGGEGTRPVTTLQVALVADGIGGNIAGETASHLTAQTFYETFRAAPQTPPRRRLVEAIEAANHMVYERAQADSNLQGMGTTVVAAALAGNDLFVAHAGDSRAYLIRQGRAYQLTYDHTWAQEAIEAGRLTPEQARDHPNRHVIKRFLGIAPDVEVDTDILDGTAANPEAGATVRKVDAIRTQLGDAILLCSDGLTDVVSDKQIEQTIKKYGPDLQEAAHHLIELANKAGGPDNITVLLLQRRDPATPLPPRQEASRQSTGRGLLLAAGVVLAALIIGFVLFGSPLGVGPTGSETAATDAVVNTPVALVQNPTAAPPTAAVRGDLPPTLAETASEPPPTAAVLVTPTPTLTATLVPVATAVAINATVTQKVSALATKVGQTLDVTTTTTLQAPRPTTTPPVTPIPTATSAVRLPTSTPVPELATNTPTPTATSVATRPTLTSTPQQVVVTGSGRVPPNISVRLLTPSEGDTVDDSRTFAWEIVTGALPAGFSFEPIFWSKNQDPIADGRGWGGSTLDTQVTIDLTKFIDSETLWGVYLVQIDPYKRIQLVSETRKLTVKSQSNSQSGDGGGRPPAPPTPTSSSGNSD